MKNIKWMVSLLLSLALSTGLSAQGDGSAAAKAAKSVRDPLGAVQTRADGSVTMTTSLPGYFIK